METIRKFNPDMLKLPMSMVIIGKSKSGKTEMVHRIIYSIRNQIHEIFLFSQTAEINKKQFFYIPDKNLVNHLDFNLIENLFEEQKQAKERKHKLLLFDDIIGDKNINNPIVKN